MKLEWSNKIYQHTIVVGLTPDPYYFDLPEVTGSYYEFVAGTQIEKFSDCFAQRYEIYEK